MTLHKLHSSSVKRFHSQPEVCDCTCNWEKYLRAWQVLKPWGRLDCELFVAEGVIFHVIIVSLALAHYEQEGL